MKRDIFHAIADPTRRALLLMLAVQPMTPNNLAEKFSEVSRQAISKHVKVLNEAGLVNSKKQGREIYYYAEAEKVNELEKWISEFKQLLGRKFEQLDHLLKTI